MKKNMREISLIKFIKKRLGGYAWVYPNHDGTETFSTFDTKWGAMNFAMVDLNIEETELYLMEASLSGKKCVALFDSSKNLVSSRKGKVK